MGRTRTGRKYIPQDAHFHEAKKKGFVARSALKLEELDKKYKIFSPALRILDLGCAPGSWLQYAASRVGPRGRLWGIDLDPVRVDLPTVTTAVGDIFELSANDERIKEYLPFDLIQSDAMSKTTGIPDTDCARSVALAEKAVALAEAGALREGGAFLVKVFEGPGFTPFYVDLKRRFKKTSVNRPEATRKGSREVYVWAEGFKISQRPR